MCASVCVCVSVRVCVRVCVCVSLLLADVCLCSGARIEEFFYEKLDKKIPLRTTNAELLGQHMLDAAKDFGPGTPYGKSPARGPFSTGVQGLGVTARGTFSSGTPGLGVLSYLSGGEK